jgi:hypothetical protein
MARCLTPSSPCLWGTAGMLLGMRVDAADYPAGVWMSLCAESLFNSATLTIHLQSYAGMIAGALAAMSFRLGRAGLRHARLAGALEGLVELIGMFLGMSFAASVAMAHEPGAAAPSLQFLTMAAVMGLGMALGGALAIAAWRLRRRTGAGAWASTLVMPHSAGESR